jgi:threonine aldolase
VQTNIVVLDTGSVAAAEAAAAAHQQGVRVSALGPRMLRAVTHLGVTVEEARTAGEVVGRLLDERR